MNEPTPAGRTLSAAGHSLGNGSLWLAADDLMRRDVGIREYGSRPTPPPAGTCAARSCREVGLVTGLGHASIEAVHEVIVGRRRPWLVVDLPQGPSLEQTVLEAPPTPSRAGRPHRGAPHLGAARGCSGVGVVSRRHPAVHRRPHAHGTSRTDGASVSPPRSAPTSVGPAADLWSLAATLHSDSRCRPPEQGRPIGGPLGPLLTDMLHPDPSARPSAEAVAGAFADLAPRHRLTLDHPFPGRIPPRGAPASGNPTPGSRPAPTPRRVHLYTGPSGTRAAWERYRPPPRRRSPPPPGRHPRVRPPAARGARETTS
ncbi:hypothetical protein [Nonomuraea dietziae]|uniref:hypothetical protein n=1 Tax=Nonomuraea dietziae TaxID=65515 RepID=UPI0031D1AFF0